jgi:hypothetical protein
MTKLLWLIQTTVTESLVLAIVLFLHTIHPTVFLYCAPNLSIHRSFMRTL